MEEVIFSFKDGEKIIRKDLMYSSAVFCKDFAREGKICLEDKFWSDYKDLFLFLQRGEVPYDSTKQKNVYKLLVEWQFQISHLDSFLLRISESKITIRFNKKAYEVSFSRFLIHSSVFRDICFINPSCNLEFELNIDEDSFIEFLDVVHGVKFVHEIDKYTEVYKICEFFGCSPLCTLFDCGDFLLRDVINGIDHPDFEIYMSENLKSYLNNPKFVSIPLPILIRLFQRNREVFSFTELRIFFDNYFHLHPANLRVLINNINLKLQSEEEIDEFGQVISKYFPGIDILTSSFLQKKSALLNQINQLQDENSNIKELNQSIKMKDEEYQKRLEELDLQMKKEKAKDQEIIYEMHQQMKQKEEEDQNRIAELTKRFIELQECLKEMDRRKKEEEEKKLIEEQEMKKRKEEIQGIRSGKWKKMKAPDFEGNIFEASAKGKLTSIIYLLANGTNVNEKYPNDDRYDGWYMKNSSPLHFSSRFGHLSVVEYLLNQKADINIKNKYFQLLNFFRLLSIMLLSLVI